MKKTRKFVFNYVAFFIFISISAFLTAFVYVELMKDYKRSSNIESFTIPNLNSIYRPFVRNCRMSMNNNMNSLGMNLDNVLRKNGWIG